MRAVIVNSGCANACTGDRGLDDAEETARLAAAALSDSSRPAAIDASQVFTMSTGVIGVHLPMDKLRAGLPAAVQALSVEGLESAERAIMTTDTVPKAAGALIPAEGARPAIRIAGIAKGAGMIHPNMATLLACLFTDAVADTATLDACLRRAVGASLNRIVIDGDTSTNDTALLLANGASGADLDTPARRQAFEEALAAVCASLARQIVRDGEGATKFITLRVTGARDERMADAVGRSIARSPLVKTAFYGEDANWGRVVCAAGYSGEDVDPGRMALWFGPVQVYEGGLPTRYSEQAATAAIQGREVDVRLDLGLGQAEATLWTCDISHDYVTINGKYRT
jgi:glutamate N-acetyltransferase/amino-acid N-acetyltransferase